MGRSSDDYRRYSSRRCATKGPIGLCLAVLAAIPLFVRADEIASRCTAFVDVTVVPMDRERELPHTTVIVRAGRIQSVDPAGQRAIPAGCRTIDGKARYLIPGLADTHVHFFGYSRGGMNDPSAENSVLLMLLGNGITTALVMEGTPEIVRLRAELSRGQRLGPRLFTTGPLIQMTGSGILPGRRAFDTPAQIHAEIIQEKRIGYDFVKVHGDLTAEAFAELLKTAREQGLRVVGHVPPNLGIDASLDGGQAMIAHAESYLDAYFRFHRALPTDPAEVERMVREISARTAKSGVWVQPTLSVFKQISGQVANIGAVLREPGIQYMPAASMNDWLPANNPYLRRWRTADIPMLQAQYSIMQRLVRGLRDAGVPMLAGTDDMVPCQLPGFSLESELKELTIAGLTPFEALQTATANAARFLGTNAGQILPGKDADLVLVNSNPLASSDNAFDQAGTMLRGNWYTRKELLSKLPVSTTGNSM